MLKFNKKKKKLKFKKNVFNMELKKRRYEIMKYKIDKEVSNLSLSSN